MSNAATSAIHSEETAATPVITPAVDCAFALQRPSVESAHEIMQGHLRCRTATCQYRKTALAVLVGAGRYVLP